MRALFGEALNAKKNKVGKNKKDAAKDQAASLKKEESDKSKVRTICANYPFPLSPSHVLLQLMKDYPFIADEMLASTGMLNDLTPEELDIELKNFMANGESTLLTLEQVIELQRAKMRAEGNPGTPVTESSLADWKLRRAEKRRLAANAKVEAELKKKKGGKGLSVLSGKELYSYNATLFVDDDDADNDQYERCSDADSNEGEAEVDVDTDEVSLNKEYLFSICFKNISVLISRCMRYRGMVVVPKKRSPWKLQR